MPADHRNGDPTCSSLRQLALAQCMPARPRGAARGRVDRLGHALERRNLREPQRAGRGPRELWGSIGASDSRGDATDPRAAGACARPTHRTLQRRNARSRTRSVRSRGRAGRAGRPTCLLDRRRCQGRGRSRQPQKPPEPLWSGRPEPPRGLAQLSAERLSA